VEKGIAKGTLGGVLGSYKRTKGEEKINATWEKEDRGAYSPQRMKDITEGFLIYARIFFAGDWEAWGHSVSGRGKRGGQVERKNLPEGEALPANASI